MMKMMEMGMEMEVHRLVVTVEGKTRMRVKMGLGGRAMLAAWLRKLLV